jgi:hypothetical protein
MSAAEDVSQAQAPIARPKTGDDPDFDPINIFREYEAYLDKAQSRFKRGQYEAASVYAAIAAHMALRPHPGFFAAPRLEKLLVDIGRKTMGNAAYLRILDPSRKIRSILHVATELTAVGGLTNMLGRWIAADSSRLHSVALTHHRGPLHGPVGPAVEESGGRVVRLNQGVGGQIAWASKLRELAREHDAVVLHTYSQDVVPMIAFADPRKTPPVLLLNHGDHLFWLGAATSDVVINLRDAAQDLSIERRHIEERRNVMVPTIVSPAVRTRSREEAKAALGIDPNTIMMFSAARGMKYRSVNGRSFADTHVELLKRHPNAELWVLGAGNPDDWQDAIAATGGRIKPLAESPDTKTYFEAADIYVDSFPFVSSTSMMEAAGLGTPLVSRFYGPKKARIFAINHPGIDKPTLHGATEEKYVAQLEKLVLDPALREKKGEEARKSVLHYHTPPSWMDFIEQAYKLAVELPPVDPLAHLAAQRDETFENGEPDCRLYDVFGYNEDDPARTLKQYLGLMPQEERLTLWSELKAAHAFNGPKEMLRGLLPDWLVRTLRDR